MLEGLSMDEKYAVVKIVTDLIKADGIFHTNEIGFFERFKRSIGFDIAMVETAEDLEVAEALAVLKKMDQASKSIFVELLEKLAEIDGQVHQTERRLLHATYKKIAKV